MTDSTRWIQTLTSLLAIALKDLQQRHPLGWHWLPRTGLNLLIFALPIVIGWVLIVLPVQQAIGTLQQEEVQLKQAYLGKLQQSMMLAPLLIQQEELRQIIGWHHQQFSDSDDPGLLLGEIAAIATRHQLTLELAHPATAIDAPYYRLLPIQLRLLGRYHDIGHFAAALAASPRLFVLANIQLNQSDQTHDALQLHARLLSFRRQPTTAPAQIETAS